MPPIITRNHEYAKILSRTVRDNKGFTSLANKATFLDSATVTQIVSGVSVNSMTIYDTYDSLPSSNLTKGNQAFVRATSHMYISDSNRWFSAAFVNLTPIQTLDPSGNITLSTDGTSTIVTITATDSDQPESQLSYSVESDGNMLATGTTITQDSSVFTITPLSEDSGGVAGNFTLTFKTTDNVNIATTTKDFSLAFVTTVAGSASTVLLMKAAGNSATNANITYQNSSDVSTGFTETGAPAASTFSPYRSGGYSTYFDGTGDRLEIDSPIGDLSSTNYTIEGWYYFLTDPNSSTYLLWTLNDDGGNGYAQLQTLSSTTTLRLQQRGGAYLSDGTFDFDTNTWYHIATVWDGTNMKVYVNGAEALTSTTNVVQNAGNGLCVNGDGGGNLQFKGYIRDFRIVTSAVYTSAGFTPPTEPLTAITGTDVLLCHLPYIADGSTNGHTLTPSGNVHTQPFGPYDHLPWNADDVGGSVYFDGSSYVYASASGSEYTFGSGNFTVEAWYWPTTLSSGTDAVVTTADTNDRQGIWMGVNNDKMYVLTGQGTTWLYAQSTTSLVLNQWNHLVAVRNGNTVYGYLNGTQVLSYSESRTLTNSNNAIRIGGRSISSQISAGYVSDVRVIKGTAQYTSNFTPPTAPLSHTGSGTSLLMNNKSDANIYDASSSSHIRLTGDTVTNNSTRKFTTSSSIYFDDGTNGLHISTPVDASTGPLSQSELFTGDFTIEYWIYPTAWYANDAFMGYGWYSGQQGSFALYTISGSTVALYASSTGSSWNLKSGVTAFSTWTNSWKHFAMTYDVSADSLVFYLDGVVQSTHTGLSGWQNAGGGHELDINQLNNNTTNRGAYAGYIQDIRVSKKLRYTTAFTPPTTEFEL